jgi:pimeloyl-ACP methyl ester carboxylesterase
MHALIPLSCVVSVSCVVLACGDGEGGAEQSEPGAANVAPAAPPVEAAPPGGAPAAATPAAGDDAPSTPELDATDSVEPNEAPTAAPAPTLTLEFTACGDGFECADALVPRDYGDPLGPKYRAAVMRLPARDPAQRIGPLFVNFGGPGISTTASVRENGAGLLAALNERFDLIAVDPRGVGQSEGAIDCQINPESAGLYAQPFVTPANLDVEAWTARASAYVEACVNANADVLGIAATANVARDMDLVRAALGEEKLSYLGFSYGTFLGATYASLFPQGYRALVLDGAVDGDQYINRSSELLREQAAAFEVALGRFFDACANDSAACFEFGAGDPRAAFDELVATANAEPLPVPGTDQLLDGDDILQATLFALYSKSTWTFLAQGLANVEDGDPSYMRLIADIATGREEDGTFSPDGDRYFALGAIEQTYATDVSAILEAGEKAFAEFPHFFWGTGYADLPLASFPVRSTGIFSGPFVASAEAPTVLVIGTTFDPATPFQGSVALVEALGNARLLTMQGDGHTAYGGDSSCIDSAVEAYLQDGVVPEVGTECEQDVPFAAPPEEQVAAFNAGTPRATDLLRARVSFQQLLGGRLGL